MIYLFCGSDGEKVRERAFSWVAAARAKAPDAPYIRLSGSEITETAVHGAVASQGLFFAKTLTILDAPFETKETEEIVMNALTLLSESPNPVAIIAPKLTAVKQKKLEKHTEKLFVYDRKTTAPARGFNAPLVNALASGNREALWLELVKATRQGDAPEMIHGLLHWKARDMMEKKKTKGARDLSVALIELLSDSRSGDLPLAEALERFALSR